MKIKNHFFIFSFPQTEKCYFHNKNTKQKQNLTKSGSGVNKGMCIFCGEDVFQSKMRVGPMNKVYVHMSCCEQALTNTVETHCELCMSMLDPYMTKT